MHFRKGYTLFDVIKLKQVALLLPVFYSCAFCSFGQEPANTKCNLIIHGLVTDGDHKEPLPGAGIYIKELQTGAVTDLNGEYTIKNLCPGPYTIICHFVGFQSQEMKINLNQNMTLDLQLFHKLTNLETVTITAVPKQQPSTLSTSSVAGEKLDALKGGTLGDALRSISGVTTIQTGPTISKPVIHGMHSQRILLLNNGVRQEGQQWGAEHAPEIDPFAIGELSVIKGAATVRFGPDAVAGVIMADAPELRRTPGFGGYVYTSGATNGRLGTLSVQAEGKPAKQPKFSWRLQASGRKGGDLHTPDYFLSNTGLEELSASATGKWETAEGRSEVAVSTFNTRLGIYSGAHIGNLTDLQQVISSGKPLVDKPFSDKINTPNQQVEHHLVSFRNRYSLKNAGKLNLNYGIQLNKRAEYDKKLGDAQLEDLPPDFELNLATHTAEISIDHTAVGPFTGTIGVSGLVQQNRIGGRRFLIPDYDAVNMGVFAIERYFPTEEVTLEAGIRQDWRQQKVYGQRANRQELLEPVSLVFARTSGTLGATYAPGHHWKYQLNLASAWRSPSINELYSNGLHHGSASFEIGNEQLKEETSFALNASVGFVNPNTDVSIQPYVQYISNYIYASPLPEPVLTIRGAFPAFGFTQSNAIFSGADASAIFKIQHDYELHCNASVVFAQDTEAGQPLPFIPPARFSTTLQRKFKGKGRLLESTVGVGHQTVARQTRFAEGSDFLPPPAGYTLVQAEASAKLNLLSREIWLQAAIYNALNTNYRDYLNRFRYFADETGRSITLRLKIPFGKTDQ